MSDPVLTAVVLNFNGQHLLETLLPSLAAQRLPGVRIVLVDNGSEDDSVPWLTREWPKVDVVRLPENIGVTRALNACVDAAHTEFVALLNNDLEIDPYCLGELVSALRAHPEAGSAGGKLLDFYRRDVIDGAGDVLRWRGHGHRRGHGEQDKGQYDEPRAILEHAVGRRSTGASLSGSVLSTRLFTPSSRMWTGRCAPRSPDFNAVMSPVQSSTTWAAPRLARASPTSPAITCGAMRSG